jgi:hypothetical protein
VQRKLSMLADAVVEVVLGDGAVRHVALGVDLQDLLFGHVLEKVAKAQDNHLMSHNQHPATTMVKRNGIERTAQAQDHVAPALPTGRSVVELAEKLAELGLVGMKLLDARAGEAVEDAELLLAQAFIDDKAVARGADTSAVRCARR